MRDSKHVQNSQALLEQVLQVVKGVSAAKVQDDNHAGCHCHFL